MSILAFQFLRGAMQRRADRRDARALLASIRIDVDDRQVVALMAQLDDNSLQRAQARVLNDIGGRVRTLTTRSIRERIALRSRDVTAAMRVTRAAPQRLQWKMEVRGGRQSLRKFGARQTRRGVTVRIRPRGRRITLPRTFIGPNDQVFRRRGRKRLPIVKLTGPAIPQVSTQRAVKQAQDEFIQREYPKRMVRELEYRMARARR